MEAKEQNEIKTNPKKKRKLIEVLKENLQKIIIAAISVIYITQGLFQIKRKDATLWDIVGSIGMSIIVGSVIWGNLRIMGIRDGRRSEIFVASTKSYAIAKEKATPEFDKLSAWCEYKNDQELEAKRKSIIQGAGLNWKAFKLGYYDDEKNYIRLNEKQVEAIQNARSCTIYRINSQEILSDLPSLINKNGNRFGESQREYLLKHEFTDVLMRVMVGMVAGMYGLSPLITGENASEIIAGVVWNTLQIIAFIAFGIYKYSQSKSFIEDEYRQTHIVQKTELLNEFIVTMQKNPDIVNKYEDDLEMEEYIKKYIEMKQKIKENNSNGTNEENDKEGVLDQA